MTAKNQKAGLPCIKKPSVFAEGFFSIYIKLLFSNNHFVFFVVTGF